MTGNPTTTPQSIVRIVMDEQPLREGMYKFAVRVAAISIVISLITGALLYLALQWLMVRPMRRMTADITRFSQDPKDL